MIFQQSRSEACVAGQQEPQKYLIILQVCRKNDCHFKIMMGTQKDTVQSPTRFTRCMAVTA